MYKSMFKEESDSESEYGNSIDVAENDTDFIESNNGVLKDKQIYKNYHIDRTYDKETPPPYLKEYEIIEGQELEESIINSKSLEVERIKIVMEQLANLDPMIQDVKFDIQVGEIFIRIKKNPKMTPRRAITKILKFLIPHLYTLGLTVGTLGYSGLKNLYNLKSSINMAILKNGIKIFI